MEKRIFIIDDSIIARNMLIRMLREDESVRIVGECGNGQGALMMLEETDVDIVILESDIRGSLDYVEIIKKIKALKPLIKIILCIDPKTHRSAVLSSEASADDFIEKPLRAPRVLRAIKELSE